MSAEIKRFLAIPPEDSRVRFLYREGTCSNADVFFARVLTRGVRRGTRILGENRANAGTVLGKLYTTRVKGIQSWLPDRPDVLPDHPVLIKNPGRVNDRQLGVTNALILVAGFVFIGNLDGQGVNVVRPARGAGENQYNYQEEIRRMYAEFLADNPNPGQMPSQDCR